MPNLSYALWSIWIELPLLHKMFRCSSCFYS